MLPLSAFSNCNSARLSVTPLTPRIRTKKDQQEILCPGSIQLEARMFPSLPSVTYVLKQALPISFDIPHQIQLWAGFDFPNLMPTPTYLDSLSVVSLSPMLPTANKGVGQEMWPGAGQKGALGLGMRNRVQQVTVLGCGLEGQDPQGAAEQGREHVGRHANLPCGNKVAAQNTMPKDVACCTHWVTLASGRILGQPRSSQLPCPRTGTMLCHIRSL